MEHAPSSGSRPQRTVVIAGASGVVGSAALRRFDADADAGWHVVGLSRRPPPAPGGATLLSVDLRDRETCSRQLKGLRNVTHLIFTALTEAPGLVGGWQDRALMETNLAMFRNVLDPLADAGGLQHVSLLQGGKAYGFHLGRVRVPARERDPRDHHDNFYFLQEDYLRRRQSVGGDAWTWTILRPQVIYGESFASPMNLLPAIGVYAAVLRREGRPLCFPGGPDRVSEAVDADLVAAALHWAAGAPAAANEIFNITNGDVFVWRNVWPAIADALGMEAGPDAPMSLADAAGGWGPTWEAIVDQHRLHSPRRLEDFVGQSFVYADMILGYRSTPTPLPALVSTVKLRQAGFGDCTDTEEMFRKWFARMQERRLLPAP